MARDIPKPDRRRHLRHHATDAEKHLWAALRDRSLGSVKFRRQFPLGRYIVDFLSLEHRLVIEIDGGQHAECASDSERTAWLRSQGFRVLRFWNNDVLGNLDGVTQTILATLPPPHPTADAATLSRQGRGENLITPDEFARLMAVFEPFEAHPRLAVAVSGGADSLALCILADVWARERNGSVMALIVDHGLRAESSAEARQVNAWLAARGIDSHALPWLGPKPKTAVQAKAREARYRLLDDWCRGAGVLHLLLGHHADDQNETVAMRRAQDSGADGLAGMAALVESDAGRRLRPLLSVPKTRLIATLRAWGQPWIDDPSNRDWRFARARLRAADIEDRPEPAAARIAAERELADWLARQVMLFPTGHARLPMDAVRQAGPDLARRALGRLLACLGGKAYPPKREILDRLRQALTAAPPGKTLTAGRCALRPRRDGQLVLCRENRHLPAPMALDRPAAFRWDGRFHIRVTPPPGADWVLAPLGAKAAQILCKTLENNEISWPVAAVLPAVWRGGAPAAVLGLGSAGDGPIRLGLEWAEASFDPLNPIGPIGFFLP